MYSFEGANPQSGDYGKEVPPVPIPNTVVKLFSADDTWREAAWESKSLPEQKNHYLCSGFLHFVQMVLMPIQPKCFVEFKIF